MVDVYFDVACDNCGHGQDVTSVVAEAVAPVLSTLIDWHVTHALPMGGVNGAMMAGRWDMLTAVAEMITGYDYDTATAWLIDQCTRRTMAGVASVAR
jgi:hypothetical protein